jgi:leader peptidase (prepilin peptidase)/N-methyltransferase
MDPHVSQVTFTTAAGLFGLCVGSFLNVAIHRYGRAGQSVSRPRRSYCPRCGHTLSWTENLPLVSYLIQGGRCRHCRVPISPRYPLVEVLNAGLWMLAAWLGGVEAWPLVLVHLVALSALLVATCVDFEHFEIPDGVSIGGLLLAPVASLAVPELHSAGSFARFVEAELHAAPVGAPGRLTALVVSLTGMAVGAGVLWGIGKLGKWCFGREAMGFGDVKLLGAAGGFIGPGGALVALMLGSVAASVFGLGGMLRYAGLSAARARARGRALQFGRSLRVGRVCGRYVPFGPFLALGIGIILLAWKAVSAWIVSRY